MILKKGFKVLGWMVVCFGLMGLMLGCGSVLKEQKKESSTSVTVPQPQADKKLDRPDARYYDFEDIQIPNELKLDTKKSRVFQAPNLIAGVLVLDGNVVVESLSNFFKVAMARDNWQAKGNFKLAPKTVLLFEKKNKRSVFFIEENMFNTHVEIWMIPTQDGQ
ncbi:MAG: hypothetical protein ABSE95_06910 [Thermodesulfobacteriota bacterium]|jgi:hypothetical protein